MSCFVAHTTIDCHHPYELSEWWKSVLDYQDLPDDPNLPEHDECMIVDPGSDHRILFIKVDDPELARKRIHFDLRPRAGGRDDEVERLRALGAVEVADHRGEFGPGTGWVVFADPEGNQFCVIRSEAELRVAGPTES